MGDLDIQNSTVQSDHGTEQGEWSSKETLASERPVFPAVAVQSGYCPPNRLKAHSFCRGPAPQSRRGRSGVGIIVLAEAISCGGLSS